MGRPGSWLLKSRNFSENRIKEPRFTLRFFLIHMGKMFPVSSAIPGNWCHLKQARLPRLLHNSLHVFSAYLPKTFSTNKTNVLYNLIVRVVSLRTLIVSSPLPHLIIYYLLNTILGPGEKKKKKHGKIVIVSNLKELTFYLWRWVCVENKWNDSDTK